MPVTHTGIRGGPVAPTSHVTRRALGPPHRLREGETRCAHLFSRAPHVQSAEYTSDSMTWGPIERARKGRRKKKKEKKKKRRKKRSKTRRKRYLPEPTVNPQEGRTRSSPLRRPHLTEPRDGAASRLEIKSNAHYERRGTSSFASGRETVKNYLISNGCGIGHERVWWRCSPSPKRAETAETGGQALSLWTQP